MNRKFRELIPLFAIALMIIAAVAFLIIINQDGSKKKKTTEVKENTKVEEKVEEQEVSTPFATEDEFSAEDGEETKESKETKIETTDIKVTTDTKVTTNNTTNAGKDSSYKNQINKLVDNALAGTATTPKIEVTTETAVETATPVVEQKQPATQVTTKPQPAKTTTTISAPTAASYTRYSTATVGSYQIAVCSGNKLVTFKNGVQVDAKDISSYATIESKVGSSVYIYVPGVGIRQYTVGSNGKITQQVTINNCQKYIVTGSYLYVLSNVNSVICYNLGDGSTKLAEVAVLNVIGGVNDLVSANNTKVVVATNNGNKTYYLDGAMFIAK